MTGREVTCGARLVPVRVTSSLTFIYLYTYATYLETTPHDTAPIQPPHTPIHNPPQSAALTAWQAAT